LHGALFLTGRLRLRSGSASEGKGFGVREEGGDDGYREDAPIFEVVVGNRGEEGAGFGPGALLDSYRSVVSGVREVARWRRAGMSAVSESELEGGGGPGDAFSLCDGMNPCRSCACEGKNCCAYKNLEEAEGGEEFRTSICALTKEGCLR
jgi:hypothetical protein